MIPILYFYSISKKSMAAWRHGGMAANAPLPGGYSPATRHLQTLYPPPTGPVPGSPAFKVGSTYTVKTKDYEKTFTLSEAFTTVR